MNTRMLADLESYMQEWIKNNAEESDWPDVWCPESLHVMMARAAGLVFDAAYQGQKFIEEQKKAA